MTLVDDATGRGGSPPRSWSAAPVRAPILLTAGDAVPDPDRRRAAKRSAPQGLADARTTSRSSRIGDVRRPRRARETLDVKGADPAEVAAAVDRLRQRLAGTTPSIALASSDEPAFAMPAAAWAARSGDPVLFVGRRLARQADARRAEAPPGASRSTCSAPTRRSPTRRSSRFAQVATERDAGRRRGPGRQRDRVRPLRRRQLRLEHQRPRAMAS